MQCKLCGKWYVQTDEDGLCMQCRTKLKKMENDRWVSVDDHLPPEHDSIFKKFKGTDKWCAGMFETISCDVIVSIKFGDGTKRTETARTKDGRWSGLPETGHPIVTHWQPFPKPYE